MDNKLPQHSLIGAQSRMEMLSDGRTRTDPETAHNRAGDTDYQVPLPETCALCWAHEIAASEARAAAAATAEVRSET